MPNKSDSDNSNCGTSASKRSNNSTKDSVDKSSEEYLIRRQRNNLAVKKSRTRSKLKTQETLDKINNLREENELLEAKVKMLTKELNFLKDMFLTHAGNAQGPDIDNVALSFLNEDSDNSLNLPKEEGKERGQ